MSILSLEFAAFVLVVWAAMWVDHRPRWRRGVLLAASVYFLGAYLHGESPALFLNRVVLLGAFIALGAAGLAVVALARRRTALRGLFWVWLAGYVGFYLMITKADEFVPLFGEDVTRYFVFVVGISYVLLRQLHVCLDYRGGLIERVDALSYLVYLLSFHTLLAGPIARYPAFVAALDQGRPALDMDRITTALSRIATGLVKKFVVAAVLIAAIDSPEAGGKQIQDTVDYLIAFHLFAIYEYLDFSGYMDIMIGIGILIGVPIPENFNRPYLARNLIDFWGRWHITLAHWVRDYLFNPMTLRLTRVMPTHLLVIGFVAYVTAFAVVGLWHGISMGFFLWGVSQGIGLGIVKIYDAFLRRRLSRKGYKRYQEQRTVRVIATLVTVEYFILTVGMVLLDLWKIL